jgi:hypothetical protein
MSALSLSARIQVVWRLGSSSIDGLMSISYSGGWLIAGCGSARASVSSART